MVNEFGYFFLSYDAEQWYMVLHHYNCCKIHETDAFMTKLHPAEVPIITKILIRSPRAGLETLAGRSWPAGRTLETTDVSKQLQRSMPN